MADTLAHELLDILHGIRQTLTDGDYKNLTEGIAKLRQMSIEEIDYEEEEDEEDDTYDEEGDYEDDEYDAISPLAFERTLKRWIKYRFKTSIAYIKPTLTWTVRTTQPWLGFIVLSVQVALCLYSK